MRNSSVDLPELAEALAGAMPELEESYQRMAVELYRLVGEGSPVAVERLAERTDLSADQVAEIVANAPGIFTDDDGNVVSFWGLSQPETPHKLEIDGRRLHTWCAWDALFIPEILGKTAQVESTDPKTGETISLTVEPGGVGEVSPPGAVLSLLRPKEGFDQDVIQSFCHFVLFFASEESAKQWTAENEDTFLLSIDDGFELGRLTNQKNLGAALAVA